MSMRSVAYRLALVFVFTVPWEAAVDVAGIGRLSKAVGLVAGMTWIVSVVARGELRRLDTFHKLFFLFLIWSGSTLLWSVAPAATTSGFLTYIQLFGVTLMFWDVFTSRRAIDAALQAYVLGAFVAAGSIVFNYVTAPPARFPEYERVNALGFQTDGIALIVAIAGPAAWYLAMGHTAGRRHWAIRALDFAYLPFGVFALVLTGTRGATLASIPMVALVLWSLWRASSAARITALAAIAGAVVLIVGFAPSAQIARIETAATAGELGEEGGALSTRWTIWQQSVRVLLAHPLAGVGLDGHRAAVAPLIGRQIIYKKDAREAHNTYLSVIVETGAIGFMLFSGVLVSLVVVLRGLHGWDARFWSAQLGVIGIGALSLSLEDSKSVWIFVSLCVCAAAVARMPARAEERERVEVSGIRAVPSYRTT